MNDDPKSRAPSPASLAKHVLARDRRHVWHPYTQHGGESDPIVLTGAKGASLFDADGNDLSELEGYVNDSGEGRWTLESGIDHDVPMPALTAALFARFSSRQDDSPAMKAVSAMRKGFGGHATTGAKAPPTTTDVDSPADK